MAWRGLRDADEWLTVRFDHAFAPAHNPWRHLGALAFAALVLAVVTGIVAFALYDTSVSGAYESGRRLQDDAWLLGPLLRGLHRYGSDVCVALTALHLWREAVRGHFRGVRWYSWITGVPLLWLLWLAGLSGLWLLWDERSLWSISATAEWFQVLPLMSDDLVRNFLTPAALNDRFFSLVMFIHIGLPLLLLGGMWIHVLRVSRVRLWPPVVLLKGSLLMLTVLALARPATSLGPANALLQPFSLAPDWYFQWTHPWVQAWGGQAVWLALALGTGVLLLLPLWRAPASRHMPTSAVAQVQLDQCNGCARCVADCPFGAVIMVARTDGQRYPRQAQVLSDLCAGCGICVGSCPTATPFRRDGERHAGIELPHTTVAQLHEELHEALQPLTQEPRIALFTCRHAGLGPELADAGTAVLELECAAMLPPSFADYALRSGAKGVVLAGCRECDCEYRLGDRWVQQRWAGQREPHLRRSLAPQQTMVVWLGRDTVRVRHSLQAMRQRLLAENRCALSGPYKHESDHE